MRYSVNRRVMEEAGDTIKRFLDSGVTELGSRLGPILWQFAATKKFDEADFGKFLELLPAKLGSTPLRHVVEPRHASFCTPAFIALLRQFSIPAVYAEHATYPAIPDPVGDFVYAPKALDQWAERAQAWAKGGTPEDLDPVEPAKKAKAQPRDVFVYFIHEGKVRAPAAAMALIERLKD